MTFGCLGGYLLGRGAGGAAIQKLLGPAEEARMAAAARRHGPWLLAVFRAVPVLAEASVIFAGASRMPLRTFLPIVALSNLGVAAAYGAVGALAAEAASFLVVFAASILVPALGLLVARLLRA
jgi:membrane protein DedA with SNARE-associated domain